MGRKRSKQDQRTNQRSILQLWGSSKSSTDYEPHDSSSVVPTIAIDLLESEDIIDVNEVTREEQSEATRPPTSDEDNQSSSPLRSAPLLGLNDGCPKAQSKLTKLFPIFSGGGGCTTDSMLSPNPISQECEGSGIAEETAPSRPASKKRRREHVLERTKSAPSHPTRQDANKTLSLSQPTTTSRSQGNAKDIIDIDTDHIDSLIRHGSRDEPINIDMSPVQVKTTRATDNFFAPRRIATSRSTNKPCKFTMQQEDALWPSKEYQHIRGPQKSFHSHPLEFARAFFDPTEEELLMPSNFLQRLNDRNYSPWSRPHPTPSILTPSEAKEKIAALTNRNNSRASISRFSSTVPDSLRSPQEIWNERWHPRCAAEVIGNEDHARYLRDWLRALEVRARPKATEDDALASDIFSSKRVKKKKNVKDYGDGLRRPTIIRTVDKSRRKRRRVDSDDEDIEDWIADDGDDEENNPWRHATPIIEDLEDQTDGNAGGGSPWKPRKTGLKQNIPDDQDAELTFNAALLSAPTEEESSNDFTSYLTNTILLSGPTGCGKTAAVYACAEELGWEVFEVYPGIGKRNGTSLLSLVGDAGKHHLVGKGSAKGAKNEYALQKSGISSFFSVKDSNVPSFLYSNNAAEDNKSSSPSSPIALEQYLTLDGTGSTSNNGSDPTHMLNRQSIILLEEVDILFGEDVNFWPTIVTLIKESRRPVVMTCNDPNIIPFSELPLQTVLYFNSCPPDLANSYIKCLALAEGYSFSPEDCGLIVRSQSTPSDVNISHVLDNTVRQLQPEPVTDLRRAINYTQFLCQGSLPRAEDQPQRSESCYEHFHWTSADNGDFCDCCDEIPAPSAPEFEGVRNSESREGNADKAGFHRLFRFSDALSMIDSNLQRSPLAEFEEYILDGDTTGDDQSGYRHLIHQSTVTHLQGGIAFYNHDSAIVSEAIDCARRLMRNVTPYSGWHQTESSRSEWRLLSSVTKLQRERSNFFVRFSNALLGHIPLIHAQPVDALVLDYAPWIRNIDAADALLEVAAAKENETRALLLGGRTTRNSQRQKYERYLTLGVDQRQALGDTAFRVFDTLPGRS